MKKNLHTIILIILFSIANYAQNRFLEISNSPISGGRFVIPNNASINVTAAQSKTITFKIKVSSPAGNTANFGRIFGKNDNGNGSAGSGAYGLIFGSSGTTPHTDLRVIATSTTPKTYGNTNNTSLASTLNDGAWHHFALVLNDANEVVKRTRLYYDGSLLITALNSTNTQTGAIDMSNVQDLIFGSTSTGGSALSFAIDDVRIYDSAFTSTQIVSDRITTIDSSNAPSTAGLLVAYDFETGTTSNVPDITGKTSSATVVVGSTATDFSTGPTLANNDFKLNKSNVKISLNSNDNILSIDATDITKPIKISIYNLLGKKVLNINNSVDAITNIPVSFLNSGIYLVNATDGSFSVTEKIIKN